MSESKPVSSAARYWSFNMVIVAVIAGATMAVLMLLGNITQRKFEAQSHVFRVAELDETVTDPAVWGRNYPKQYDSYLRTVDMERTRHGGSEAFQKLDEYPVWRDIFAGYAFSIDYREERGHAYMLVDQQETLRVTMVQQYGACLHCHSSNIVAYRKVGLEHGAAGDVSAALLSEEGKAQLMKGFEVVCGMKWEDANELVTHPVTCMDCHDPGTMALRVTRPGFMVGIDALARSDDPLPHLPSIERWRKEGKNETYDPNKMASRQEMRSMVCAQCHVEYYFKGENKLVTYPWHKGLGAEEIEAYYDEADFKDWIHKLSGAPVLKAQHPEFELWSQGIHARSGVSCADCHMPYKREGAVKVSDHHTRSPLLNINNACQTCHRNDEEELLARAELIQDRTRAQMKRAEEAVVQLIRAIAQAQENGADDQTLHQPRQLQRKAQWRLDFVAAENSMGFHAPQEATRLLGEAIDYARQGQIELLKSVASSQ